MCMKKIVLFLLFITVIGLVPAHADTMVVQAITDISTTQPSDNIKVRVMRDCTLEDISLKIGYVLEGKIIVTDPKRLKRDATFTFYPIHYTDLEGKVSRIPELYYGKFSPKFEIDAKSLAESAVAFVADHFIKGISIGFYVVQGAVQNKQGNHFKSAVTNAYEHSLLSYANKGNDLYIEKDSMFGLKFSECKNLPMKKENKSEEITETSENNNNECLENN